MQHSNGACARQKWRLRTQLLRTGDYTQNPGQPPEGRGFECYDDFSPIDEPLRIVSVNNSENHPDKKSERRHSKRDEVIP
jgi:hypothetical protein